MGEEVAKQHFDICPFIIRAQTILNEPPPILKKIEPNMLAHKLKPLTHSSYPRRVEFPYKE